MKLSIVPNVVWPRLSEFIADKMGLHFSPERYADLERGLAGAAEEFGFGDAGACADWLLTEPLTKAQLRALASHLTVGETYFFREKRTFEVLAESVLPQLMRLRRNSGRRLRLWSAACCTGEEPFSLAILLHQFIPDLADTLQTPAASMLRGRDPEMVRHWVPLGRFGQPEDYGDVVVFLASPMARFVTGHVIPVDGGTLAASGWYLRGDGRGWTNLPDAP